MRFPEPKPLTRTGRLVFGLIVLTAGVPAVLAGVGLVHAEFGITPPWVVATGGFLFVCAGLSLLLGATSEHADVSGALLRGAPLALRLLQGLVMLAVPATFAMTLSWIAFGEGARPFAVTTAIPSLLNEMSAALTGRVLYGAVALVMWWFFAASAERAWRTLFAPEQR